MQFESQQFLWVEKYRPKKIDDCVLPASLKKTFKDIVANGEIPNMILSGGAGIGKTTVARALCSEMDMEYIFINASEDSGIDVLRNKIRTFASSVSLNGNRKVVILDEADYLNPNSIQPALRGAIEEFAMNCRFIMTCNFKNRIIEPLHSRCTVIDFKIENKEKPELASMIFTRVENILSNENIKYEPAVVVELVKKHFPDFRKIINELQRYSSSGVIDKGILVNISDVAMTELIKSLKEKDFSAVRKWIVDNLDNDHTKLYRKIYDFAYSSMVSTSIPKAILIISDYQYKCAFVADQEINLTACLIELMSSVEWK